MRDLHRFQVDGDHALKQLQGVLGVAHSLYGPIVGVFDDAAGPVGLHTLAFRPVRPRLAVDKVVVGFQRYAGQSDGVVLVKGAEILSLPVLAVAHFSIR